jgi:hypothetical protein
MEKVIGVNVFGHFCCPSGLRHSTLALVEGLGRAGVVTSCRDVRVLGVAKEADRNDYLGKELHANSLFHVQPEPVLERLEEFSRLRLRDDVRRIGNWYWESDKVPASWAGIAARMRIAEAWAPSRFIARAFSSGLGIPVHYLPTGLELPPFATLSRMILGLPEHKFIFLFMFDMHGLMQRKNPLGLIHAFSQAFGSDEPVQLVIRARHAASDPSAFTRLLAEAAHSGAMIIPQPMSREDSLALMEQCDCYGSLHRGEGFGLTMAEAMLMGKPVIATAYSGNMDFMDQENSYLVEFELTTDLLGHPYPVGSTWASPSIDHAASLMRYVYENRAEAWERGQRAKRDVAVRLSLSAAGQRMADRLKAIENVSLKPAPFRDC